jgi:small subunit ribosomal protein S16
MIEFKLFRRGRTHLPIYDVVVAEKRKKNGGEFIAKVGVYDPLHPSKSFLREDVVMLWLSYGARMTTKVHDIMSKAGIFKKLYNHKENQPHATTVKNQHDATTVKNQPHATTVKNQSVKKEEDNSRTAVTKD